MKKFVSIRIRKLHDWGMGSVENGKKKYGVAGLTAHDLRLIETPNADPNRLREITICNEETGWNPEKLSAQLSEKVGANQIDFIAEKAKSRIKDLGIDDTKPGSCKVVNLMVMVSPQWLRDGNETQPLNPEKAEKWTRIANDFLRERFGDNYLGGIGHMDELNPHLTGYVLPAVFKVRRKAGRKAKKNALAPARKTWGLDSKSMFTPDQKVPDPADPTGKRKIRIPLSGTLSCLQTEFAAFCQKQGLDVERGVVGSRAKYREVADYNHLLRSQSRAREEVEKIADIATLRNLVIAGLMKAEDYDRITRELDQLKNQLTENQRPLVLANTRLSNEKAAVAAENQRLSKELAEKSRAVPVGKLVEKLTGVEPQPAAEPGKYRYVLHTGMALEVDETTNKFRNLTPHIKGGGNMQEKAGGRGGIDAAIYLTGCTRDAATLLITDLFSSDTAAATISQSLANEPHTDERMALAKNANRINFEVSQPDESKWPELRRHFIDVLKCDAKTVDDLKRQGQIHANTRGHLVTVLRYLPGEEAAKPTGRIIQDVRDSGGGFYIEYGDGGQIFLRPPKKAETVVVSDLVEALALDIHQSSADAAPNIVVVGRKPKPKITALLAAMAMSTKLFVAAARSEIGQRFAQWMKMAIPAISVLSPPNGALSWSQHVGESLTVRKRLPKPDVEIT